MLIRLSLLIYLFLTDNTKNYFEAIDVLAGAACESVSLIFIVVSVIRFDSSEKLKFMLSNPLILDPD